MFDILNFDKVKREWLKLPPKHWKLMSYYREFESFVFQLPVVNDAAERNVRLIQDFVNSSHDEELRQDLPLVIEK